MDCKIDYVSFSVPTRLPFEAGNPENNNNSHMVIDDFLGGWWLPIATAHEWEIYKAKGFYHTRIFDAHSKVSVFFGTINRHVHVEFGGQSLDYIRALGFYEDFLQKVTTRASRVDFAVDFESEVSVQQFIVNRQGQAFKAGGDIFSEDGETSYVGSWKGERFARVYRYHPPHPRSNKLRAEVVLRGDYAKQALAIVQAEGELQATLAAHKPFGWKHELWQPSEAVTSKIVSKRSDKEAAGTLRWLNGDVVSAIVNAHGTGLQDAYEWFEKYVAPRIPRKRDIIDDLCP